jgi:hypothetical protein
MWVDDSLTLGGREIRVRAGRLPQADLRFYPDNPRIYSLICAEADEPSQMEIQERLSGMDHVKQLAQSIEANGGVTDPLIVRDGDLTVLEGNSRLAAYRLLGATDPIRWGEVKVRLLPKDIEEDLVFALLGEYHIIGRKDWAPYEQAGYLYRRAVNHNVPPSQMAKEMGISTQQINHLIAVYEFMLEHNDIEVDHWSYYDEYLRSRPVKNVREQRGGELDRAFSQAVRRRKIEHAVDVRNKLSVVAKGGGKALEGFISGKWSLDEAYDRTVARGVSNTWYKRLNHFRAMLADPDTVDEIAAMPAGHRQKCLFELRKLAQVARHVMSRVK